MTENWFRDTVGDHSINAVAQRSGLVQGTLNRQLKEGRLSPEATVAIARAYGVDVLDALVTQGLLAAADLRQHGVRAALEDATDEQIADLVLARMKEGRGQVFNEPISLPRRPRPSVAQQAARHGVKGVPDEHAEA